MENVNQGQGTNNYSFQDAFRESMLPKDRAGSLTRPEGIESYPAIIFDCESTGLVDARIIEGAWIETDVVEDGYLLFGMPYVQRFDPQKPSSLGALNVHHILDSELVGMPAYTEFKLPDHIKYIIGQNVQYDMSVIGDPQGYKLIDTVGIARKLWPEADSHSLAPMMYHIFGRTNTVREMLKGAHSALADCRMTWFLLEEALKKVQIRSLEELWVYSEQCRISTCKMQYGKYKGYYLADIKNIEPSYLVWITKQLEMDANLREVAAILLAN